MNFEKWQLLKQLLPFATLETLYMVFGSALFGTLIGFPLGLVLFETKRGWFYGALSTLVNIGRGIPFAILLIAVIPFTRFLIGSSLGTTASIVPLTLAAAPFFARLTEAALTAIPIGLQEAACVMGATRFQIVRGVLFPEALPALIRAETLLLVNLIGYSAMAGLVGGGGLGKVAIQYGYQRFNPLLMMTTLVLLLALVQLIQSGGEAVARRLEQKRGRQ